MLDAVRANHFLRISTSNGSRNGSQKMSVAGWEQRVSTRCQGRRDHTKESPATRPRTRQDESLRRTDRAGVCAELGEQAPKQTGIREVSL